jgi:hypothetical protein
MIKLTDDYVHFHDGATFDEDLNIIKPVVGFFVSSTSSVIRTKPVTVDMLRQFISDYNLSDNLIRPCYYGYWVDGSTDVVYLDNAFYFEDLSSALKFAKAYGQIFIYDIEGKKLLPVNSTEETYD